MICCKSSFCRSNCCFHWFCQVCRWYTGCTKDSEDQTLKFEEILLQGLKYFFIAEGKVKRLYYKMKSANKRCRICKRSDHRHMAREGGNSACLCELCQNHVNHRAVLVDFQGKNLCFRSKRNKSGQSV